MTLTFDLGQSNEICKMCIHSRDIWYSMSSIGLILYDFNFHEKFGYDVIVTSYDVISKKKHYIGEVLGKPFNMSGHSI